MTQQLDDTRQPVTDDPMPTVFFIAGAVWLLVGVILGASLTTQVVGAILIGFLPCMLLQWSHWQNDRTLWGGVLLIYPAVYVVSYGLGSVAFSDRSVLGVDPDRTQWALYGAGLLAFLVGAGLFGRRRSPQPQGWTQRGLGLAHAVGLAGLAAAGLNYATGGIPILSSNVNEDRFAGTGAVLGRLTGVIVGMEQFALVVLLLAWWQGRKGGLPLDLVSRVLALVLVASLLLSASRTFLILPLVAVGLVVLEWRPTRLIALALSAVLLFWGLTWYNLQRQEASGTLQEVQDSVERSGLSDYPLASGLLSLQIGPRVFQVTRDKVPSAIPYQRGDFFLTDGSIFLRTHKEYSSDYFTTTEVTGRDYEKVGGSPPTVLGGLYIDGGIPLMIAGMLALGAVTRWLRNLHLRVPHLYTAAAFGYWSVWMMHAIYNYVSLKPMVVTFLVLCVVGSRLTRTASPLPSDPHPEARTWRQ